MPTLIKEDGSCVDNANTLATVAEFLAWADRTLGAEDAATYPTSSVQRALMASSLEVGCSYPWAGCAVCADCSELAWPRSGLTCATDASIPPVIVDLVSAHALRYLRAHATTSTSGSGATSSTLVPVKSVDMEGVGQVVFGSGVVMDQSGGACATTFEYSADYVEGETTTSFSDPVSAVECRLKPYLAKKVRRVRQARLC